MTIKLLSRRMERLERKFSELEKWLKKNPGTFKRSIWIVKRVVAKVCDVRVSDLSSKARPQYLADVRALAMTLCVEYHSGSHPKIGKAFDRDQSMVSHAAKRMIALKRDSAFKKFYAECRKRLDRKPKAK